MAGPSARLIRRLEASRLVLMTATAWVFAAAMPLLGGQTPPDPEPGGGAAPVPASQALAEARASQEPDRSGGLLSGGVAIEKLGEDWFARLELALGFDFEQFGFALQLPVRLRIIDEDPQNDDDLLSVVREEDWDSVADVMRILRYMYVGQRDRKGPYYLRLGALTDMTIGHGTIMHRYRNDVDINRWRVGFEAAGRVGGVGARAFVADLTEPYLSGGRVSVRPLEMALGPGPMLGLEVGASLFVDADAPLSNCLRRTDPTATGMEGCLSPTQARGLSLSEPMATFSTQLDDQERPLTAEARALAVVGIDVGYELVSIGSLLSITPYVDANKITAVEDGYGLHAGVLWNLGVPVLIDTFVVDVRTEYRVVSQDYRGPYFNGIYEIERYESLRAANTPFGTDTKLAFLCGASTGDCRGGGDPRQGYFFEVLAGLPNWIFVGGELLDYTGNASDGTFRLTLDVPALSFVQIRASYFRVGVRNLDDLFAIDDRSAVLARVTVPFMGVFNANVEWSRIWQGDPNRGYEPVDNFQFGAGFAIPL